VDKPRPDQEDLFLLLLRRFQEEGVSYVLVGGQAVRLNGFLRATEDVDILLEPTEANGEKVIKALGFLASAVELDPTWFNPHPGGEVENIRVADDLIIDLLFAANGQTLSDLKDHIVDVNVHGVSVKVLSIDGLLKTKTDYREKDILDKSMLRRLRDEAQKQRF
jgi:hypothetical protein